MSELPSPEHIARLTEARHVMEAYAVQANKRRHIFTQLPTTHPSRMKYRRMWQEAVAQLEAAEDRVIELEAMDRGAAKHVRDAIRRSPIWAT